MDYTAKQQDLIRRIREVSARIDHLMIEHRMVHNAAGQNMVDGVTALRIAIQQSNELGLLFTERGEIFREFLDTL